MPPGNPKEQRNPPDKMSQGRKKHKRLKKKSNQSVVDWFALSVFLRNVLIKRWQRRLAKDLGESFNVGELMQGWQ